MTPNTAVMDFHTDFNPLSSVGIATTTSANLPVTPPDAVTPFATEPRLLCKSIGLSPKWNLKPLSLW
jgi:hypothetical protein